MLPALCLLLAACARRVRSNTPLQALTTLNETLFVEAARALAMRVITEAGSSDHQRLTYTVRRCLARDPLPDERQVLQDFLNRQKKRFADGASDPWPLIADDDAAKEKLSNELPDGATPSDVAAWTALARVVLNLDETISKE